VRDEEQRKQYLGTLQTEANRLAHLVENVLAYARIERGNLASRRELMTGEQLLSRVESRLFDRARQAGLELSVETTPEALEANTRCDASAVEQILFNLVDNACKYGGSAGEKKLHLSAERQGKQLALRVRDHGPGITDRERWRLFRPFCKSATDAAHSAPGVGLGLSLSRRLARDMRGDLTLCTAVKDGGCFL
jgi:K+-sensing histidine kinase KdpD